MRPMNFVYNLVLTKKTSMMPPMFTCVRVSALYMHDGTMTQFVTSQSTVRYQCHHLPLAGLSLLLPLFESAPGSTTLWNDVFLWIRYVSPLCVYY